jgi:nitroreductase
MELDYTDIKKAVLRSQHCQRNWDLSKSIPEEDIELLTHAVSNCPSKQNIAFYKTHFITDRTVIEKIHTNTEGFHLKDQITTNSQTLANLLIVFTTNKKSQGIAIKKIMGDTNETLERDLHMASGIAAGYVNLTANILGYSTGCCACFNSSAISEILGTDEDIVLLMGVGYKNTEKNRRVHHLNENQMFPSIPKEPIVVNRIV